MCSLVGRLKDSAAVTMATTVWHRMLSLRFSGLKPYLQAGTGWLLQVKDAVKVLLIVCNPVAKAWNKTPHVTHKIKMASVHMSMEEVSKTYKITPVRRL